MDKTPEDRMGRKVGGSLGVSLAFYLFYGLLNAFFAFFISFVVISILEIFYMIVKKE